MKKIFSTLIFLSFMLALSACSMQQSANNDGEMIQENYATVWSAPATVKIQQDDITYAQNGGAAELTYNVVKNEYESQQLFLTAKTDISSYYLLTDDLVSGTNTLSKDNFEVYSERYVTVTEKFWQNETNLTVPDSYKDTYTLPDALIPIQAAEDAGEMTIAKNQNGALWITVYIPKDTPAGVYEGNFVLEVEGMRMNIPVSVTVNDYTLADTPASRTLFSWRYDDTGMGECDSSIEMMQCYYDFYQDYGISLQSLPMESLNSEELVEQLEKYYDQITSYSILSEAGFVSLDLLEYRERVKEQILTIASISSTEKNYFDKAMLYYIDEPNLGKDEGIDDTILKIQQMDAILEDCVNMIESDTTGKYTNFKAITNWKNSIMEIPNIMPLQKEVVLHVLNIKNTEKVKTLLNLMNCFCTSIESFTTGEADDIQKLCNDYDLKLWCYSAWLPLDPAPNYHIATESALAARTFSWVQKKYDIEGILYWDTAGYTRIVEGTDSLNVYEDPIRWSELTAGDGFLTYPGEPYGVYGPIPSIRLMEIRDGIEEYDMLAEVEDVYKEKYQWDILVEYNMNQNFYNKVSYDGYFLKHDGQSNLNFTDVRATLINTLTGR